MSEVQALPRSGFSGKQVVLIVLAVVVVSVGITYWFLRTYVYASEFEPVLLSAPEQAALDGKLADLGLDPTNVMPVAARSEDRFDEDGRLIPERYSEDASKRSVSLSEKELNALVASNPDLARRFAIDLSENLASSKLLIPVDPEFPVLGGKTLRVTAGLELDYRDRQPIVILRGVSVMGIPIPNAWLGNLKNVDLVGEFGGRPGFWQSFAAGVETIAVGDGTLDIELKE